MSDVKNITPEQLALKVTMEMLMEHLEESQSKDPEFVCPVCHKSSFTVPVSSKDPTKPMIVTMPLPQSEGRGIWNFQIMCNICAHSMYFNTGKICSLLKEKGKI